MYFLNILASLVSVASLTSYVSATLRITADHHSFGGVNFPELQFLEKEERFAAIRTLVKNHVRVVRLFIRGSGNHTDPEPELGVFDQHALDVIDDTLAAIHYLSKGQIKVIIAPHDAHALRATNGAECDVYCQKLEGAFLDFYSDLEIRKIYKTRLDVIFKHYPSRNFNGASWSTLSDVILGVDVQNEPWSGIWPIISGEPWLCDVATHLKEEIGLGESGIAVITGGISGAQSPGGFENFPDCAFDCAAIDVIGVHGYYSAKPSATAGMPWANMFLPGNTLTARALAKKKLILVEEWEYQNTGLGFGYKKAHVWDQGNALNYRGIPWIYSYVTTGDEGNSARISITRAPNFAIGALAETLKSAYTSRSNFNWAKYIPAPPTGLTNLTVLPINPFTPVQSDCTFGCEGWLCDAADGCSPDLICKNSVCQVSHEDQPGNIGEECHSKAPCQEHLSCVARVCEPCRERKSIRSEDRNLRIRATAGHIDGQCELDTAHPFRERRICRLPKPQVPKPQSTSSTGASAQTIMSPKSAEGNPCLNTAHCSADEYCSWGRCVACTSSDRCLGAKCRTNNKCLTGFCNTYGHCDYPGQKKRLYGPGASAKKGGSRHNAGPRDQMNKRGGSKVRDEAMKINIPAEEVMETGGAKKEVVMETGDRIPSAAPTS
ncbi:glycoside hydrolase family 5 protein [Amniculicola lignicola CBS 123094]|uniref:Glycoside hydrolase family 5 protein n=1 Tax=Amniculicola lignicola CBS 123094 TaxID=1392246 RepID=A0A6A5WU10_9PLEO|nr:glycoside hydrolase family 5 protein [Amniculicola lignicola CBS 123094]